MRAAVLALCVALAGCAADATQIVVVVDAEATLTEVSVEVLGAPGMLAGAPSMQPTTAVLRHTGGSLGPYEVIVRAETDAGPIERRARVRFVANETLMLPLCMQSACVDATCADGTCQAGTCGPVVDTPLVAWAGTAPSDLCRPAADGGVDGGADAAPDDASTMDAGSDAGPDAPACTVTVCGVSDVHLPGDPITPTDCGGREVLVHVSIDAGPSMEVSGVFHVPGDATTGEVMVEDRFEPSCRASHPFVVAPLEGPFGLTGAPGVSIRDMDARRDVAFLATQRNLYAGLRAGWREIMHVEASDDLEAVRMFANEPHIGPRGATSDFYRLSVSATYTTTAEDPLFLSDEDSDVRAMARDRDGLRLLLATKSGVYVWDPARGSVLVDANDIGRGGAVAVSSEELGGQGPYWAGEPDGQIFNYGSIDGRTITLSPPIGVLGDLEVDDGAVKRLWVCGSSGLLVYERLGISTDSSPITTLPIDCRDLAMARGGGVWAATGSGLERYDANGARRVLLPIPSGATNVATTWDDMHDQVWVLGFDRQLRLVASE